MEQICSYLDEIETCYCLGTSSELVVKKDWRDVCFREVERLDREGIQIGPERVRHAENEMLSQVGLIEVESRRELLERGNPCSSISVITHDAKKVQKICEYIARYGQLTTSISGAHSLEIMSASGSKGQAVEFLAEYFHLDMNQIIAIGDDFNDKDMIEKAGLGIAMGNAPDEVKKISCYVTQPCQEDGVAHAIEELIELF